MSRATATAMPIATRISGRSQPCSMEYLRKKIAATTSARPAIAEKSRTPTSCSQSKGGEARRSALGARQTACAALGSPLGILLGILLGVLLGILLGILLGGTRGGGGTTGGGVWGTGRGAGGGARSSVSAGGAVFVSTSLATSRERRWSSSCRKRTSRSRSASRPAELESPPSPIPAGSGARNRTSRLRITGKSTCAGDDTARECRWREGERAAGQQRLRSGERHRREGEHEERDRDPADDHPAPVERAFGREHGRDASASPAPRRARAPPRSTSRTRASRARAARATRRRAPIRCARSFIACRMCAPSSCASGRRLKDVTSNPTQPATAVGCSCSVPVTPKGARSAAKRSESPR